MSKLFDSDRYGICGCMAMEGEAVPIYCDVLTGDFLYYDETSDEDLLIAGISDTTAKIGMDHEKLFLSLSQKQYGEDAIGIIFCEKNCIVLTSETTCEYRRYGSMKKPTKSYQIVVGMSE